MKKGEKVNMAEGVEGSSVPEVDADGFAIVAEANGGVDRDSCAYFVEDGAYWCEFIIYCVLVRRGTHQGVPHS